MTPPAQTAPAGDLEPGWSRAEPNGFGPCYKRHVPGHGLLEVIAGTGGYHWWLTTLYRHPLAHREGRVLPYPRDAMRDAEQRVAELPARMFQSLTPGETQELYRRLNRARDWGQAERDQTLPEICGELFTEMQIQATDPSYAGIDPYKFIRAVKDASYGAALQAMAASPNRAAWIATPPRRLQDARTAAAAAAAARRSRIDNTSAGLTSLESPARLVAEAFPPQSDAVFDTGTPDRTAEAPGAPRAAHRRGVTP